MVGQSKGYDSIQSSVPIMKQCKQCKSSLQRGATSITDDIFDYVYIGECYHILSAAGQVNDDGDDEDDNDPVWMISLLGN